MATITKIYDSAYVSGDVAISLTKGDLVLFCVHWTWNNSAYLYNSGSVLINGVALSTGYIQSIAADGNVAGDYMAIFPYLVPISGSVNVSLNPIDTIAQERYIRLSAIKITPSDGYQFVDGNYIAAAFARSRDAVVGSKAITPANMKGDVLVGVCTSLNPDGTLRIAWTSPATELLDAYVNGYVEVTVATQVSENDNDEFLYYQNGPYYNGGVAVAVRELLFESEVIWWM